MTPDYYVQAPTPRPIVRIIRNTPGALILLVGIGCVIAMDWYRDLFRRRCARCDGARWVHACGEDCAYPDGECAYVRCTCR